MKRIKYLYFSSMLFMGAISISACTDILTENRKTPTKRTDISSEKKMPKWQ